MDNTFSNRCRACAVLIYSDKMVFLFENSLRDMFTNCTSLEISSDDSLPNRICPECFGQLSDFNRFRQSCINSDAYFRQQIVFESIKVESPIDVAIKFEEDAVNQDFVSELFDTESIDSGKGFAQNDTDLITVTYAGDSKALDTAKFICDYCGKQCGQKNHLAAHMSAHYTVKPKTFPCTEKGCHKVLKGRQSLKNHRLKVHELESEATETVKLKCPQCPKSFDIQLRLDAHIRSYHQGLKGYKCEQCSAEYCTHRSLRRHLRSRHSTETETQTERHDCPHDGCDTSYKLLDSLKKHIDRIHVGMVQKLVNGRKLICDEEFDSEFFQTPITVTSAGGTDSKAINTAKFICDYCGKQFSQKNFIAAHMATHFTVRQKTFPCTEKGCWKVYKCRKSLKNHRLKVHELESEATETVKLKCPQCPKSFDIQLRLDAHIRSYHHGLKAYKCEQCEKEYDTYRSLKRHLLGRHGARETERHDCPYDECDKSYRLVDSLTKHIDQIHMGKVPVRSCQKLICDQCGRSFKNGFKFKEHTLSHLGIRSFACEECPKKFTSNYRLKIHVKRHLKPFQCPMCGRQFSSTKALKSHINFHTKETTYPCKECPRVFPSYGAISRHVRIHHRNHKPYICPHCQREFTKAETMRNHIMTHTGEKPFSCSVCGHRFIQGVALRTHMKVHAKK